MRGRTIRLKSHAAAPETTNEIPDNKRLYVHCGSGLRASFAVPYLTGLNLEVVYVDGAFSEIPDSLMHR
jgi:hydroxyacylglutathione hydrolase